MSRSCSLWWVAVALGVFVPACSPTDDEAHAATPETPEERPASLVETASLQATQFVEHIELNGVTDPVRSADVRAQVGGRIITLNLVEGQTVERGDSVMVLNASQGRAGIDRMQVEQTQIESDIARTERLISRGLGTQAELERLQSQRDAVSEGIAEMRAGINETRHRAPIGGLVTDTYAEQGEYVGQGDPVARIVDVSTIVVRVGLPEREIAHVSEGQDVDVRIDSLRLNVTGTIHRIGIEANRNNRTFPIEIYVPNDEHQLRAGMRATAIVTKAVYPNAIVVPRDAIIQTVNGSEVFVAHDGVAEVRPITLGPGLGRFVVAEGLAAGDELVVRGHRALVQGETVEVTRTQTCCDEQFRAYRLGHSGATAAEGEADGSGETADETPAPTVEEAEPE